MKPPTVAFGLRPGTYDITIYSPTKLCYLLDFLVVVIYAPSNFVNGCVSIAAKLFVRLVDRFMILHISDPNTDFVEICTARITGINGCALQRSFHQGQAGQRLLLLRYSTSHSFHLQIDYWRLGQYRATIIVQTVSTPSTGFVS